mmetsp:Transcript_44229/g.117976  ORF Transcript_44229/g.117976 Transcript_44229/m.117976 type:complete len:401 (+) Transcript_44229:40-1242(+)
MIVSHCRNLAHRAAVVERPFAVRFMSDNKRKGVFVAGTMQHHGKTTITLGLTHALLKQGRRVAYQKPVGQQTVPVECNGKILEVDRDVDVFKHMWPQLVGSFADCSPVAFPPAFTRHVLDGKETAENLRERCVSSFERLVNDAEYVVVEGTGHIGVGSIVGLNNAQVASALGLECVMVVPGGLGNSFDLLTVNLAMLDKYGVKLKGVIVNKVDPTKIDMVRHYYAKAMESLGAPVLGVVPLDPTLGLVSFRDIVRILKARVLTCPQHDLRSFMHTRLIISTATDVGRIRPGSLLVVNIARMDLVGLLLEQHRQAKKEGTDLKGGVILVGPEKPPADILKGLEEQGLPSAWIQKEDYDGTGYRMLAKVIVHTPKFLRSDMPRLVRACEHVSQHIDLDRIVA